MKEYKVLKFMDLFKNFFEISLKVDYGVMRTILKAKLTMDRRRSATIINNSVNSNENSSTFGLSMLFYIFIGGMLSIYMAMPLPTFFVMSVIMAVIMFFITLTMVSDFSSVLLDLRDKNIILKAPVDYRTLNMAKTIHIIIYLTTVMAAFTIIPLGVSIVKYGIGFFLIFLVELILMAISIIFFTSIIYYIILSIFDGEKLKDIINYVQIFFTIAITVGQQLANRLFTIADRDVVFTAKWWCYLIPSFWMSAPLAMLREGAVDVNYIYLSILSVTMPIALFIVYIKFIAPHFEMKLQKMASVEMGIKKGKFKQWIFKKRSDIFCRNKVERGVFDFIINITSSERKLKLALYPSLAMSVVFPFLFVFMSVNSHKSFGEIIEEASKGKQYLFMYMTSIIVSSSMMFVSRSENYKAAWIYRVAPVEKPSLFYKAAIKAVLAKYAIPIYIFQGVIFLALCGVRILPDLIVMFFNVILISLIMMFTAKKALPFSKEIKTSNSENTGMIFLVMIIATVIGGIHFGLTFVTGGNIILGIIVFIAALLMWKYGFNFDWEDIEF